MSSVVMCGICPHPPIMVPAVGQGRDGEVARTKEAMLELGRLVRDSGAQTLVMISPHAAVFADVIAINTNPALKGDLRQFGAAGVKFSLDNDLELAGEILAAASRAGVVTVGLDDKLAARHGINTALDHGITAPLYFIRSAGVNLPLVHISMGMFPFPQLYSFGVALRDAAAKLKRKVAVLASGDLSHRLTKDAPAGYDPVGQEYDRRIVELTQAVDVEGFQDIDAAMLERAGECGLRSISMMLGALDGQSVQSRVLSYEGPFGVGYLVAALLPGAPEAGRRLEEHLYARANEKATRRRKGESYPVKLARTVLERYLAGQKEVAVVPASAPEEFAARRAGVFVSLKKHGQLRGCIGTIEPTRANIIEEITANAVSAAARDPRFPPVSKDELAELDISVDILTAPEPVLGPEELDPQKYGVIVSSGCRRGLLLPALEGVNSVAEQVDIARQKAGISPGESVRLERFAVIRYH
ncbi:MAG: AmmeMemoRadiSam system protein A [Firmicutes bacterium]|nr:AmmeMemoRadiSam system protein A [Bacillota bacterium]